MIKELSIKKLLVKKTIFSVIFVILTTLIFTLAYLFFTRDVSIKYSSSVKILIDLNQSVSNPTTSSTNFGKIQQLIPTYAQIVTSDAIAQKIAGDYPEIDPEEAQQSLSAINIDKTIIMNVRAKSDSYEKAVKISSTASRYFIETVKAEEAKYVVAPPDQLNFKIIDNSVSVERSDTRRSRNLLLVAFSTFFISAGGLIVFNRSRTF